VVAACGSALLFGALFLPWFSLADADTTVRIETGNAFGFGLAWIGSLVVVVCGVLLARSALNRRRCGGGRLEMRAGVGILVGTILIIIQTGAGHPVAEGLVLERRPGAFLGVVLVFFVLGGAGAVMIGGRSARVEKPAEEGSRSPSPPVSPT
jgi:hypothetical protein